MQLDGPISWKSYAIALAVMSLFFALAGLPALIVAFPAWWITDNLFFLRHPFLPTTNLGKILNDLTEAAVLFCITFLYFFVLLLPTRFRGVMWVLKWWPIQLVLLLPGVIWGVIEYISMMQEFVHGMGSR